MRPIQALTMRFKLSPGLAVALVFAAVRLSAVDIVAHRGASFDAPENTIASQQLAWEQQADAVETDVQLTKDCQIIVIHDYNYCRTTGHDAPITDLTLDEARALDAGSWKDSKYAGEKLPTLDEQFARVPEGKRILVEIKVGPELVPELVRALTRTGFDQRKLTVMSFEMDALQAVREQLPRIPTLYLVSYRAPNLKHPSAKKQPTLNEVIAQAKSARLTGLDLQDKWPLTPTDVKMIKAAGLQLHVWTIDDVAVAKHWIELGVDSITTNRPAYLRQHLGL